MINEDDTFTVLNGNLGSGEKVVSYQEEFDVRGHVIPLIQTKHTS